MNKRSLFIRLAAASGYTGVGVLLGYSFSDHTINTALWVGILLVLVAAVLIGMYVSARSDAASPTKPPVPSASDDPPFIPKP